MRLGRIILFAGLAPLLSLSALAAAMTAAMSTPVSAPSDGSPRGDESLIGLSASAVIWAIATADDSGIGSSRERPSRQAVLSLAALASTPLMHSVWMIQDSTWLPLPSGPRQILQLRC